MDYLKKLKEEIERKKRKLEESNVLRSDKKYFKRGELAAKETEEYLKKHFPQEAERIQDKTEDRSKKSSGKDRGEDEERNQQPRKEVIRKLRERGEPITLFGETHYESYMRLKKLESLMPDISNAGVGENDFKAAMDAVDQQYLNDIISSSDDHTDAGTEVSVKDDGTTEEDLPKMRAELGSAEAKEHQDIILRFFKFILKEWGDQLNARPAEEKRTTRGKMASAIHTQTVAYLKPLFKTLKNKEMEEGLLESFVEIVQHMMDRHYIKANDSYLEMAIGNAPWPIGVTMVGIHARTGREKISSRYVAHVLNDETQRKYIQAVKRLITQCQKIFPTVPSRSFNFQCPV
ncbi:pre-mRNA-splicing factor 18-like [Babylonia areolata]|uniref:pre-mRNA-splicing factor 18-like n=1 Tax=Babylonia areolata TaxID=304850 RepID=UPI003FD226F6